MSDAQSPSRAVGQETNGWRAHGGGETSHTIGRSQLGPRTRTAQLLDLRTIKRREACSSFSSQANSKSQTTLNKVVTTESLSVSAVPL